MSALSRAPSHDPSERKESPGLGPSKFALPCPFAAPPPASAPPPPPSPPMIVIWRRCRAVCRRRARCVRRRARCPPACDAPSAAHRQRRLRLSYFFAWRAARPPLAAQPRPAPHARRTRGGAGAAPPPGGSRRWGRAARGAGAPLGGGVAHRPTGRRALYALRRARPYRSASLYLMGTNNATVRRIGAIEFLFDTHFAVLTL